MTESNDKPLDKPIAEMVPELQKAPPELREVYEGELRQTESDQHKVEQEESN